MLRREELLEIKEMLLDTKKQIMSGLEDRFKTSGLAEEREIGDIFDDADLEQSREFNLMLSNREKEKLSQIDAALELIEEGEYGICEDCGENIPMGRLKAMPFATLCVKCKSKRETEEGPSYASGRA